MKYSHIPECRVNFVCVLDETLVDEEQLTRFVIIAGQLTAFSPELFLVQNYFLLFYNMFIENAYLSVVRVSRQQSQPSARLL